MAARATEHPDDLLAGYAAGAADAAERARVEAHLARCLRCRLLLEEYEEAVHSLALLVPPRVPPLRVRAALFRRLPARRRSGLRWAAAWTGIGAGLLVAAGVAMSLALLGLRAELRESGAAVTRLEDTMRQARLVTYLAASPETEVYVLKAQREGDRAYGMLMAPAGGRFALLVGGGLTDPGPGRVYQVWLSLDGERVSGGLFTVDDSGWAQVRVQPPAPLSQVASVGVTVEPAGGSVVPTTNSILVWARP